jgi:hypothetical protein
VRVDARLALQLLEERLERRTALARCPVAARRPAAGAAVTPDRVSARAGAGSRATEAPARTLGMLAAERGGPAAASWTAVPAPIRRSPLPAAPGSSAGFGLAVPRTVPGRGSATVAARGAPAARAAPPPPVTSARSPAAGAAGMSLARSGRRSLGSRRFVAGATIARHGEVADGKARASGFAVAKAVRSSVAVGTPRRGVTAGVSPALVWHHEPGD